MALTRHSMEDEQTKGGAMVRKYSVSEIRSMRNALNLIIPARESRTERITEIEEQLRTYMANGTTWEELEQEARRIIASE